jgi:hypothetical protein
MAYSNEYNLLAVKGVSTEYISLALSISCEYDFTQPLSMTLSFEYIH